jgi:integrase
LPHEAQGPATTKIQLALKVWPVTAAKPSALICSCHQLRIEEALAVEKADFRDNGTILRVYQQTTRDGRETAPLKKRKRGEYREITVPTWLRDMIRDLPDGPLMIGNGERRYQLYRTAYERFMNAADKAGIPAGFTPHSLRHAFASAMLSKGVPITNVAHWLGHRDVRVTYRIYGHLVASAAARAIEVLDEEYAEWSKPAKK